MKIPDHLQMFCRWQVWLLVILAICFMTVYAFIAIKFQDKACLQILALVLGQVGTTLFAGLIVSIIFEHLKHELQATFFESMIQSKLRKGLSMVYPDRDDDRTKNEIERCIENSGPSPVKMIGISLKRYFDGNQNFENIISRKYLAAKGRSVVTALILKSGKGSDVAYSLAEEFDVVWRKAKDNDSPLSKELDYVKAQVQLMNGRIKECCEGALEDPIVLKTYDYPPYCTAIILDHVVFFNPNFPSQDDPDLPVLEYRQCAGIGGIVCNYQKICDYWDRIDKDSSKAFPEEGRKNV